MTPFPEVRLGNICSSIDYGHTAVAVNQPVGPKFLRITDIQDSFVDWNSVQHCECNPKDEAASKLEAGDIVFARTGATTGKSFLIRECPARAVFASYLIRVRSGPAVLPEYLAHFFHTREYWAQIAQSARGAAQAGVNATNLKNISIPYPSLSEQRRIAAILDDAYALRDKRRQALAELDRLPHSLFCEAFGDSVKNEKGWASDTTLGDVAEIVSGITKGRRLNGQTTRVVPYLAVSNVQDRKLDLRVVKTIEATEDEIDRYRLSKHDLLLTEGGDPDKLGRGCLWQNEIPECIHQNHIFRVRLTASEFHPLFLSWLVGSQRGKQYFLKSAKQTTGIASINMTQLKRFPLLIPPYELQLKFAEELALVESLRATQSASLSQMDALFASLQYRAFRGKL